MIARLMVGSSLGRSSPESPRSSLAKGPIEGYG